MRLRSEQQSTPTNPKYKRAVPVSGSINKLSPAIVCFKWSIIILTLVTTKAKVWQRINGALGPNVARKIFAKLLPPQIASIAYGAERSITPKRIPSPKHQCQTHGHQQHAKRAIAWRFAGHSLIGIQTPMPLPIQRRDRKEVQQPTASTKHAMKLDKALRRLANASPPDVCAMLPAPREILRC